MEGHLKYINGALCIHGGWLYSKDGIMTPAQYRHMIERKQAVVVQCGGNGRLAWLRFDSLPDRYRQTYTVQHGDPHTQKARNLLESEIEFDGTTYMELQEYQDADGAHLPEEQIKLYANNASILNALRIQMSRQRESNRSGVGGRFTLGAFWATWAPKVASLDPARWQHSLPSNVRRLAGKYLEYTHKGWQVFIHGNTGNKHAIKIEEGEPEALLMGLASYGNNLTYTVMAEHYNMAAEVRGWKKITPSAIALWCEKHRVEIEAARHGKGSFDNELAMQATRSRPTGAMLYWTVDGWKAELAYQEKKGKEGGHYVTTYDDRPMVIFVLDPCVNYIIGYAIGDREDSELINEAMRNAYRHVKELFGARYLVYQVQSDHFGRGCLKPMYKAASKHYTPARKGNAKAKVVERYNHWFNTEYLSCFENWTGHNAKASAKNQPNGDFKDLRKRNFPDKAGCWMQIEHAIAKDREKKIEAYRAAWARTPEDKKEVLSEEMYLYLFGSSNGHRSQLKPDGVRVTIGRELYRFECFDRRFREHGAVRWEVKYDPADLSQALAVNEDGTLRFMLEQKYVQPMALADRSAADDAQLRRMFNFNEEMKQEVIEKQAKAGEIREAMFRMHPELENDTLVKFLITDSRGQHKNRLYEQRKAAQLMAAGVEDAVTVEDGEEFEVMYDPMYTLNQL